MHLESKKNTTWQYIANHLDQEPKLEQNTPNELETLILSTYFLEEVYQTKIW